MGPKTEGKPDFRAQRKQAKKQAKSNKEFMAELRRQAKENPGYKDTSTGRVVKISKSKKNKGAEVRDANLHKEAEKIRGFVKASERPFPGEEV